LIPQKTTSSCAARTSGTVLRPVPWRVVRAGGVRRTLRF
jgi:hypothetical protein